MPTTSSLRYNRATAFREKGDGRLWPRSTPASVSQRVNRFYHGLEHHAYGSQKPPLRAGTQARAKRLVVICWWFNGFSDTPVPPRAPCMPVWTTRKCRPRSMAIPVAGQKANEAPSDYFEDEAINQ